MSEPWQKLRSAAELGPENQKGPSPENAWPSQRAFAQITKSRTTEFCYVQQMSKRPLLVRLDFNGPDESI